MKVKINFVKHGRAWKKGQIVPEGTFEPDVQAELESNGFLAMPTDKGKAEPEPEE